VYSKLTSTTGETRYILSTVSQNTVISTLSESGQVAANQTLTLTPQVSGQVTSVLVKPGQTVRAGQLIATINATDALQQVTTAKRNLQSAQLTLAKLKQPATELTLTQQQNALTQAQQSLETQYQDAFSDVTSTFVDLPTIIAALQDIDLGNTIEGSQQNIDYYADQAGLFYTGAKAFRDAAYADYQTARSAYDKTFADLKTVSATPDHTTIEAALTETYNTTARMATAVKSANDLVQLYVDQMSKRNNTVKAGASTHITNLQTYQTKLQTHLSQLLSDRNALATSKNTIVEKQQTLAQTRAGADTLDIEQNELSVAKAQDALDEANQTLAKYSVRAPFDGTIGSVPVQKYDQAQSATTIATLVTNAQYASLTVNEVDAAKLQLGQKATLTFDAIPDLTLTGTIAQIDSVGTVSQGVVSYEVRISFDTQDARIKSGMTVNAVIQTGIAQDALTVPSSAIKTQNGQTYVQLFDPALATTTMSGTTGVITKQTPLLVPVQTGLSDAKNTVILTGLDLGQQIVTRTTTGVAGAASSAASRTSTGGFGGPGVR
jgi:RND family efflux transporter MFP subunit